MTSARESAEQFERVHPPFPQIVSGAEVCKVVVAKKQKIVKTCISIPVGIVARV